MASPSAVRKPGPAAPSVLLPPYEIVKARVLARLQDRLDPSASKRMPMSLLQQSIRSQAEQMVEAEAGRLTKPERERLVNEVLAELLGYGPLDELFKDAAVREIMVTGSQAVIVRRENAQWVPTNVRFRDEEHLRSALDKLATHADPLGGAMTSMSLFDLKLPNGFRAVGVVPPPALGQPATVGFLRTDPQPAPTPIPEPWQAASGSPTASPRPGSPATPPPSSQAVEGPLARHRNRIVERLIRKLASLGVFDLKRVEVTELRNVVAAYITEYLAAENLYLSDADQGRLLLEILAVMQR